MQQKVLEKWDVNVFVIYEQPLNAPHRAPSAVYGSMMTAAPEDETVDRDHGLGYRIVKPLNDHLSILIDKRYGHNI